MAALLFVEGEYVLTEADGTHSGTTVALGQIADLYDTNAFRLGYVVLRAGEVDSEIRRITAYARATGVVTVNTAWDTNPVDGDSVELYKNPASVPQMHHALNGAIVAERFNYPLKVVSDRIIVNNEDRTLDVPTGWLAVNKVTYDERSVYGDRQTSHISSLYRVEKTFTATTSQRGQSLRPVEEYPVAGVAVRLRKVGTLTGSLYARLRSDSAGTPTGGAGGILVSSTAIDVANISDREWVYFPFATTHYATADDQVHVTLDVSGLTGLSASNYLAWCGETASSPFGNPSVSSDTGTTWTGETGYRLECRLVALIPDYCPLPWSKWRIIKGDTPQVHLSLVPRNAEVFRLEGQKTQDELDTDDAVCYLPSTWLVYHAAADYLAAHASHADEAERRSRNYRDMADRYLPVSASLVKQRLVEWY